MSRASWARTEAPPVEPTQLVNKLTYLGAWGQHADRVHKKSAVFAQESQSSENESHKADSVEVVAKIIPVPEMTARRGETDLV